MASPRTVSTCAIGPQSTCSKWRGCTGAFRSPESAPFRARCLRKHVKKYPNKFFESQVAFRVDGRLLFDILGQKRRPVSKIMFQNRGGYSKKRDLGTHPRQLAAATGSQAQPGAASCSQRKWGTGRGSEPLFSHAPGTKMT